MVVVRQMEMLGRLNVCGKKINFGILIKYYRFFLYGLGVVYMLNPEDNKV